MRTLRGAVSPQPGETLILTQASQSQIRKRVERTYLEGHRRFLSEHGWTLVLRGRTAIALRPGWRIVVPLDRLLDPRCFLRLGF